MSQVIVDTFLQKLSVLTGVSVTSQVKELVDSFVEDLQKPKVTKKDPNAPKKKTAYVIFASEIRSSIQEENPSFDSKQVMSEIGRQWGIHKTQESELFQK